MIEERNSPLSYLLITRKEAVLSSTKVNYQFEHGLGLTGPIDSVKDLTPGPYKLPLKWNTMEAKGCHSHYTLPAIYMPPPREEGNPPDDEGNLVIDEGVSPPPTATSIDSLSPTIGYETITITPQLYPIDDPNIDPTQTEPTFCRYSLLPLTD